MVPDKIDISKAGKRKKKQRISITVDKKNLDFIKNDARENEGIDDLNVSALFDMFLEDFVKVIKKMRKEEKPTGEIKSENEKEK